jgi:hypothetical protein
MGTLHEDQYLFFIISHSVLLRIENISDNICRENKKTFFFNKVFRKSFRLWDHVKKCSTSIAGLSHNMADTYV